MYAPYQIRLDDGRLIFAPQDIDEVSNFICAVYFYVFHFCLFMWQVIRLEGSVTHTAEDMAAADLEMENNEVII